jgi:hypothetical protein
MRGRRIAPAGEVRFYSWVNRRDRRSARPGFWAQAWTDFVKKWKNELKTVVGAPTRSAIIVEILGITAPVPRIQNLDRGGFSVSLLAQLRAFWQVRAGHDDAPWDGDTPIWLVSFVFHLAVLLSLSALLLPDKDRRFVEVLVDPIEAPPALEVMPTEFRMADLEPAQVGAAGELGIVATPEFAPEVADVDRVELDSPVELRDVGEFVFNDTAVQAMSEKLASVPVKGTVGIAATGASGAIDRLVQEILRSLEERPTLVVWMFDQSASLLRQRDEIMQRIDGVYSELSAIQASGAAAFAQHADQPLLSQVCAFGKNFDFAFRKPTDDVAKIKEAIRSVAVDESGIENVFSAVTAAVNEYRDLRRIDSRIGDRERNVMIVVISDEAGDDIGALDHAVTTCQKYEVPVYVIGVPAPFGRVESEVKWVDPDPRFDQTPQWTTVHQGPESVYPERLKFRFAGTREDTLEFIDSGFGPFGLTRLCYDSGGIYFTVHPNRATNGLRKWQTSEFSAYLAHFFDPDVMRKYRPDYVSVESYQEQLRGNQARFALVEAAQQSWITPLESPETEFRKFDEAEFVNAVSRAQRAAALAGPSIDRLYEILKAGETHRELEISPRWQAGFDLAYGTILAAKVRADSYNEILANAKTNLKFSDPKNNTWRLSPDDAVSTGSQAEKLGQKAKQYLRRVVDQHPNTPWSLLAQNELKTPISWRWTEGYTEPPRPPSEMIPNNVNIVRPPQAEQAQMLAPPKPTRLVPKL